MARPALSRRERRHPSRFGHDPVPVPVPAPAACGAAGARRQRRARAPGEPAGSERNRLGQRASGKQKLEARVRMETESGGGDRAACGDSETESDKHVRTHTVAKPVTDPLCLSTWGRAQRGNTNKGTARPLYPFASPSPPPNPEIDLQAASWFLKD